MIGQLSLFDREFSVGRIATRVWKMLTGSCDATEPDEKTKEFVPECEYVINFDGYRMALCPVGYKKAPCGPQRKRHYFDVETLDDVMV